MSSVSLTFGFSQLGFAHGRLGLEGAGPSLGVFWRLGVDARNVGVVPLLRGVIRCGRGRFRWVPALGFGGAENFIDIVRDDRRLGFVGAGSIGRP